MSHTDGFTIKSEEWWRSLINRSITMGWPMGWPMRWMVWSTRNGGDPVIMGRAWSEERRWIGCYYEGELVAKRWE